MNRALLVSALMLAVAAPARGNVYFVDANALAPGSGGTWCTAFADLQDALAITVAGDEIRVADGVYRPDRGAGDVLASFVLPSGVKLFGGHAGCGASDPDERDPAQYETVLSGDLAGDDGPDFTNYGENSFIVVRTSQAAATTLLDGVTITGGNADGPMNQYDRGGGLYNFLGAPMVRSCLFRDNRGTYGGAIANDASDAAIADCRFEGNLAPAGGGAVYNYNSQVSLQSSNFAGNAATAGTGGAVYALNSQVQLTACDFCDNLAYGPGAVSLNINSDAHIANCHFDGNVGSALALIAASHALITDSGFEANRGPNGAAIYVNGTVHIYNSTFTGNIAENNGGALGITTGEVFAEDCVFTANSAPTSAGGAAVLVSNGYARFNRCRFADNSAERGGAIYLGINGLMEFLRCEFLANDATQDHAGALYVLTDGAARLSACRLLGNTAAGDGGGVYVGNSGSLHAVSTLFAGNQAAQDGGGAYNGYTSTAHYANCTFTRNLAGYDGDGIYNSITAPIVENSILWDNGGLQSFNQIGGTAPQLNYSCVPGSWGGVGNTGADPQFVDADGPDDVAGTQDDDPRLAPGSPCINQGDNTLVLADLADADADGDALEPTPIDVHGHARVLCAAVDMGASESGIGDANCDGVVLIDDFATWAACMTGPDAGPCPAGCAVFDFEFDSDVDARDYAAWQRVLSLP